VHIRRSKERDRSVIMSLARKFASDIDLADKRERLADAIATDKVVVACEDGDKPIGFIYAYLKGAGHHLYKPGHRELFVSALCVNAAHHRKGTGKALLGELLKSNGHRLITCHVDSTNEAGVALLKSAGFEQNRSMFHMTRSATESADDGMRLATYHLRPFEVRSKDWVEVNQRMKSRRDPDGIEKGSGLITPFDEAATDEVGKNTYRIQQYLPDRESWIGFDDVSSQGDAENIYADKVRELQNTPQSGVRIVQVTPTWQYEVIKVWRPVSREEPATASKKAQNVHIKKGDLDAFKEIAVSQAPVSNWSQDWEAEEFATLWVVQRRLYPDQKFPWVGEQAFTDEEAARSVYEDEKKKILDKVKEFGHGTVNDAVRLVSVKLSATPWEDEKYTAGEAEDELGLDTASRIARKIRALDETTKNLMESDRVNTAPVKQENIDRIDGTTDQIKTHEIPQDIRDVEALQSEVSDFELVGDDGQTAPQNVAELAEQGAEQWPDKPQINPDNAGAHNARGYPVSQPQPGPNTSGSSKGAKGGKKNQLDWLNRVSRNVTAVLTPEQEAMFDDRGVLKPEVVEQMAKDSIYMTNEQWMKKYPVGDYEDYKRSYEARLGLGSRHSKRSDSVLFSSRLRHHNPRLGCRVTCPSSVREDINTESVASHKVANPAGTMAFNRAALGGEKKAEKQIIRSIQEPPIGREPRTAAF
jgi:ribosomal protein S18 acetylase RimI-like enzyme